MAGKVNFSVLEGTTYIGNKNDGTEISRYSFKNLLDNNFTFEDFKQEINEFNITLAQQEEFTNIKELSTSIKIHNW